MIYLKAPPVRPVKMAVVSDGGAAFDRSHLNSKHYKKWPGDRTAKTGKAR